MTEDFNPQRDDLYQPTFDELVEKLNRQATALVQAGNDPDKVQSRLQERIGMLGQAWEYYGPSAFVPKPKDEFGYKDQRGDFDVATEPTKGEKALLDKVTLSDDIKNDINADEEGQVDLFGPSKAINRGLLRSGLKAAQGLAFVTQNFPEAEEFSKQAANVREGKGAVNKTLETLGGLPVTFASGGATLAPNAAQDTFDQTGDITAASHAAAISALTTEASLGIGALGRGLLGRSAAQVAAGPGMAEINRRYMNEHLPEDQQQEFDPADIAINSAVALAGAAAHGRAPKSIKPVITGDPDFDAGVRSATKNDLPPPSKWDIYEGAKDRTPEYTQTFKNRPDFDVSTKQNVSTDVADLGESVDAMNKKQSDIDKAYQQKAAEEKASRDLIPDILDELSPQQEGAGKTVSDLDQGQTPVNNPLDTPELRQVAAEKAKQNAQFPQGPEDVTSSEPGLGKPSTTFKYNKIDQAQPVLDFTGKTDLTKPASKDHTPAQRAQRSKSILDQIAEESGKPVPAADTESNHGTSSLPRSIWEAHDKGELTVQHVVDSIADNHDNLYDKNPTARGFLNVLRDAGAKLGGLDTKIEVIPSDPIARTPEHKATVARLDKDGPIPFDKAAGYYDPETNKVYIKGDHNLNHETLVHESAHAITHNAISKGLEGKLEGPQRQAFERLKSVFEQLKPQLEAARDTWSQKLQNEKGLGPKTADNATKSTTYGLTDLHEMMSEMFANPKFRDYLKAVPLEGLEKKGVSRTVLGRVRNAYDAVVKNVRGMLGLSPKADNALDALFSGSHEFIQSIDNTTAKEIRENNSRNTALPKKEEKPYRPGVTDPLSNTQKNLRNTGTAARRLFTWKTTAPEHDINEAKSTATGSSNLNRLYATEAGKNLDKIMAKEGVDHSQVTDYMQGKDKEGLANAPKTKQFIDENFKKPARANALELARLLASNPNARKVDLDLAQELIENKDYTTRAYQPERFTERLLKNARNGDAEASAVVDRAKSWIKDNLLPTPDMGNKTIQGLRTMAKALGINVPKELEGISSKSEKRSKLQQLIKDSIPEYEHVDKAVEKLLYEVAGITNKGISPVAKYYRGVRSGDILTTRKAVPPELRALWGEIKDPASVLIQTLVKQGNGIAQLHAQASIRDLGIKGGWLFDKKMGAPDGFTEKLNGRKMGALQDLYTSPEVKDLLNSQLELSTASNSMIQALMSGNPDAAFNNWAARKAMGLWTKAVGIWKVKRLATDFGYYAMYAIGGPQIAMLHGIADPRYGVRGLMAHLAELSPRLLEAMPEKLQTQMRADRDLIIKSGLNESSMAGELMEHLDHAKLIEAARTGAYGDFASVLRDAMFKAGRKGMELGVTGLSLTDGWAKRAALLHRMDVLEGVYKRSGETRTPEQIRAEAADWIKDTTITNQRTPAAVRLAEKLGASQGLIYGVETIRNTLKAAGHVAADLGTAYEKGDAILAGHALKQAAGIVGAIGYYPMLISAVGGTMLAAMGMTQSKVPVTDKRQEYLQEEKSRFEGQQPEVINDPNNPDKNNQFLWAPSDRNGFYYQSTQPIMSLYDDWIRHNAGQKIEPGEAAKRAFSALTGTVLSNGFVNKLMQMAKAKPPGWMQDAPNQQQQAEVFYTNMGMSAANADRMLALEDIFRPGFLQHWDSAQEMNASPAMKKLISLGLGVVPIKADANLSTSSGGAAKTQLQDIKSRLGDTIKSPAEFTDATIDKAYKLAFKDSYKSLKELHNASDYARENKLQTSDIAKSMDKAGITTDTMGEVLSDKLNPATILYSDLSDKLAQEYRKYEDKPDMQKHLLEVYRHRMKHLGELTKEYAKLSPDQIEDL